MKWNTRITRKRSSVALAATVSLLAAAPAAHADWLDVIAENITVTNVRTGQSGQDGYGPKVTLRQSLLGRYQLASGRHELTFEVTGKNQQSTNYIVGVDRLQLTLVP